MTRYFWADNTYHETNLTKLELREIPALASKMEEWVSPFKSVETTSSSVYPSIPVVRLADVLRDGEDMTYP